MTKDEFIQLLDKHDWWYSNSDDTRVWTRGSLELNKIQKVIIEHPELAPIYEERRRKVYNLKK